MDKREVYILSGLHKATNVISKKTNYKRQKVTKPQPVFLYNRHMSDVDLTDQFLQYYSFLHKSVKWSKKFFVHCLNMVILNAHIVHKKYSDSKIMHWQFRMELVKHMLSNACQQPWGIVPVPNPVVCPLHLVDKHFIDPIPGQKGGRRKHQSCTCFICNVSKEALSDASLGDSYKPKQFTSYWCSICKCALCIDWDLEIKIIGLEGINFQIWYAMHSWKVKDGCLTILNRLLLSPILVWASEQWTSTLCQFVQCIEILQNLFWRNVRKGQEWSLELICLKLLLWAQVSQLTFIYLFKVGYYPLLALACACCLNYIAVVYCIWSYIFVIVIWFNWLNLNLI